MEGLGIWPLLAPLLTSALSSSASPSSATNAPSDISMMSASQAASFQNSRAAIEASKQSRSNRTLMYVGIGVAALVVVVLIARKKK